MPRRPSIVNFSPSSSDPVPTQRRQSTLRLVLPVGANAAASDSHGSQPQRRRLSSAVINTSSTDDDSDDDHPGPPKPQQSHPGSFRRQDSQAPAGSHSSFRRLPLVEVNRPPGDAPPPGGIAPVALDPTALTYIPCLRADEADDEDELSRKKRRVLLSSLKHSSLCILSGNNPVRQLLLWIVQSRGFEVFIMLCILVNCVFLAMNDPTTDDPPYTYTVELVFASIFSFEMLLKIVSQGFAFHPGAYVRDPWNLLDCTIVILSWLNFAPGFGNFSAFRTLRVIRPLRSVNAVPGLKGLIATLLKSFRVLANVVILTCFLFVIFGILGVQLWQGTFRYQCVDDRTGNITTTYGCKVDATPYWGLACPTNSTCTSGSNPGYGYLSFDNIWSAWLICFQFMTFEGWPLVMLRVYNSFGIISFPIFVVMLLFGSYFIPNLALAVISNKYEEERAKVDEQIRVEKERKAIEAQRKRNAELLSATMSRSRGEAAPKPLNPLDVGSRQHTLSVGPTSSGPHHHHHSDDEDDDAMTCVETITVLSDSAATPGGRHILVNEIHRRPGGRGLLGDAEGGNNTAPNGATGAAAAARGVPWHLRLRNFLHVMTQGYPLLRPTADELLQAEQQHGGDDDDHHRRGGGGGAVHPHHDDPEEATKRHRRAGARDEDEASYDDNDDDDEDGSGGGMERRVSPFMAFIMFCIVLNTALLAAQHYNQPELLDRISELANYVFTIIFTIELILSMTAMGPIRFLKDGFNVLDFIVVVFSIVEIFFLGSNVVTVFRALRLLRVIKLLKNHPSLRGLVAVIVAAMSETLYLVLITGLFLFIAALSGMQFFGGQFNAVRGMAGATDVRFNFDSFLRAFYTVFQVLTTDGWVDIMWVSMVATHPVAAVFFIFILLFGTYCLINLFLSILINGFRRNAQADMDDDVHEHVYDASKALKERIVQFRTDRASALGNLAAFGIGPPRATATGGDGTGGVPLASEQSLIRMMSPMRRQLDSIEKDGGGPMSHGADFDGEDALSSRPTCRHCGTVPQDVLPTTPHEPELTLDELHEKHCSIAKVRKSKSDILRSLIGFCSFHARSKSHLDAPTAALVLSQAQLCDSMRSFTHESFLRLSTWDRVREELQKELDVIDLAVGEEQLGGSSVLAAYGSAPRPIITDGSTSLCCLSPSNPLRCACAAFVRSTAFEAFIVLTVVASGIALAFDSPLDDPNTLTQVVLDRLNLAFTAIFCLEMILKIVVDGLIMHPTAYLRNGWNVMDALIVVTALVSLAVNASDISSVKVLRRLRAVRPLRAIRRNRGLRLVFLTLVKSIKGILHVGMLVGLNFIVFGVLAVQLFGGKFYSCTDPSVTVQVYCTGNFTHPTTGSVMPRQWLNEVRNFDHLGYAFVTLFQISTGDNWADVMNLGIDAVGEGVAPQREHQPLAGLFFVSFYIIGNFFLLNLFIGVLIFNFNQVKDKLDGMTFMTEEQKIWVEAQRFMLNFKPRVHVEPLSNPVSRRCGNLVQSAHFEIGSTILILVNVCILAMDFYGADDTWNQTLYYFNTFFVFIFLVEAILKLLAFGPRGYFTSGWNRFDFLIVILGLAGFLIGYFVDDRAGANASNFALIRVLRVFRISRALRLFKQARQVQVLLETLWYSLPSIVNISIFILLLYFVYSVLCVQLFAKLKPGLVLDDGYLNFKTFLSAMQMMFIFTTNEMWSDAMFDCMIQPPYCSNDPAIDDCGTPAAPLLFISFVLVSGFIVANLFIAVILDNFETTLRIDRSAVTMTDLHRFTDIWSQMNPDGSMMMATRRIPQLLALLHPPLGITRKYSRLEIIEKLGTFHILDHHGQVHFVETLIPLSRAVMRVDLPDLEERRQQQLWHNAFPELDELPVMRFRERAVHVGHFFCSTYIAAAFRRSRGLLLGQHLRAQREERRRNSWLQESDSVQAFTEQSPFTQASQAATAASTWPQSHQKKWHA